MNVYCIKNARLVDAPRQVNLGERKLTECRVADNPLKRKDRKGNDRPARFVTIKFWEYQADMAAKLSKGDIIAVHGELEIEQYEGRDGTSKTKDTMTCQGFTVVKSETFYGRGGEAGEAEDTGLPF